MKVAFAITWLLEVGLLLALPFKKSDISILRRKVRSTDGQIGCIQMESFPGELVHTSDGTTGMQVCGLYLIGQPDQVVELEFSDVNIMCQTGGVLAILDGWELNREIFPGIYDHAQSMNDRYHTFCGDDKPDKIFISSQNVALVHFRIPAAGEGFRVKVNFKPNPQPCNAITMFDNGVLTMKNYGNKRNCTVSIIYPEKVKMLNVDVGVTAEQKTVETEVGLTDKQCMNYHGGDYVELMNGNGLDTDRMETKSLFCGMESSVDKNVDVVLGCQHSVVRMVSSGEYYNSVTFQYAPPTEGDLQSHAPFC